jgi:hypothetical protein
MKSRLARIAKKLLDPAELSSALPSRVGLRQPAARFRLAVRSASAQHLVVGSPEKLSVFADALVSSSHCLAARSQPARRCGTLVAGI